VTGELGDLSGADARFLLAVGLSSQVMSSRTLSSEYVSFTVTSAYMNRLATRLHGTKAMWSFAQAGLTSFWKRVCSVAQAHRRVVRALAGDSVGQSWRCSGRS
jgi:hypothetical protein